MRYFTVFCLCLVKVVFVKAVEKDGKVSDCLGLYKHITNKKGDSLQSVNNEWNVSFGKGPHIKEFKKVDDIKSISFPDILKLANEFLEKLEKSLDENKIQVKNYELDHICYRAETMKEYLYLKEVFESNAVLIDEKPIGGRLISNFKLNSPIVFNGREIFIIELPAPKPGKGYSSGFEHAEFVIDISFEEFMDRYPHLDFSLDGANKDLNADIRVNLEKGMSVKFHHQSLEKVIELENQELSNQ